MSNINDWFCAKPGYVGAACMFDRYEWNILQDPFEVLTDLLELCWPFGIIFADLDMHIFRVEVFWGENGNSLDHLVRFTYIGHPIHAAGTSLVNSGIHLTAFIIDRL